MNSKTFLFGILLIFLIFAFMPKPALAWNIGDPIVPQSCGNAGQNPCGIGDFFTLLLNIYNFIVKDIATPLAVIALIIGGILMMISAGNPSMFENGKKIVYAAIIGLVLVFCSYIIINFIITALGGSASWSTLPT